MATGKVDMKIVMLGKEYVGKTCLAQRYLHERFSESGNYMAVSIAKNILYVLCVN